MFRLYFLMMLGLLTMSALSQQKRWILNKKSIIKDSSGRLYEFEEWKPLIESQEFIAVAVDTADANTSFILQRFTHEMWEKWMQNSPRPKESSYFKTGKKFSSIKAKTIQGKKINTKDLKGKILVINYWFIDCMPCRKEIPELNELFKRFEGNTNIVFISIAKDSKNDLKTFLETTQLLYSVISDNVGGAGISSFPTNVVVDNEGKVVFHASGYSPFSIYWIRKTIEELQNTKKSLP